MCSCCMQFPETFEEFVNQYSFKDKKEIYTNGAELIPSFRVEQGIEYYLPKWINVKDRLPNDEQDVLAFSISGDESKIIPVNYCNGKWFDCIFNVYINTITHWIPLPKPPKELIK